MSLPKAVKIKKNGVEYISNVNRLEYTLTELIRAALRDTGKFICNRTRQKIRRRTGRLRRAIQYWVLSTNKQKDMQLSLTKDDNYPQLIVGYKKGKKGRPDTYGFYGAFLEEGVPGKHKETQYTKFGKLVHKSAYFAPIIAGKFLYQTTYKNISQIREIQAQYLSALGTERGENIINEKEYEGE